MLGRTNINVPNCPSRRSTETVLTNSQSPSFVDFRKISEAETKKKPGNQRILKIRDAQKRQRPLTPILFTKIVQPAAKKVREDLLTEPKPTVFFGDFSWQIRENEKSLRTILASNVNIFEMYRAICESASLIPVPHSLLIDDKTTSTDSRTENKHSSNFSIEDRKQALLNVFSRRFGLKVSAEALHLGAALFDICLDVMRVNKETLPELAAVTLVIASKIEDVNCLTIANVIEIDLVEKRSVKMVASLERLVLATLSFEVTIPTPLSFATYMLVHLCAPPSKINLTYYFLELSIIYVHNRMFSSDVVANAATCLAFAIDSDPGVNESKVLRETELKLLVFTGKNYVTKKSESREVMRILTDLFLVAPAENHSIYREYSTSRRNFVALRRISPNLQETLQIGST